MSQVVVIGAGVLGASVAYRLAQAGCAVTVLEARRVGAGTSGASYAWLNSSNKAPRAYHDLNVAGMAAHAALADEFPATPWLHRSGGIEIASGPEAAAALEAKVARLRGWDYAAELITPARLAELEPDLDLDAIADPLAAWCPAEGYLDPVLFAGHFIRAAAALGARLLPGVEASELAVAAGRVAGVVTRDGQRIPARHVVNCAGRWADLIGGPDVPRLPLAPRVGMLVFTPPVPVSLSHVLRTPLVDLRPDGAGRLMLHDNAADAQVTLETPATPDLAEATAMVRQAARLFPGLHGVSPEAVRITARPVPADRHSAVGPVPGVEGYYMAVTHSAVTLAAYLGRLIAQEVAAGQPADVLAPFRPARFWGGAPAALAAATNAE